MVSDRAAKEGFQSVDRGALLSRLAALEVSEWSYRKEGTTVRHIGPMAQDFRAAFGLGTDGEHIHGVDASGVAIAAIQELHVRLEALAEANDALRRDNSALVQRIERLERAR